MGNLNNKQEIIPVKYLDNIEQNHILIDSIRNEITFELFNLNDFDIHHHLEAVLNSNNYVNGQLSEKTVKYFKILILKNPSLIHYQNENGENLLLYCFRFFHNFDSNEKQIIEFLLDFDSDVNILDRNNNGILYYLLRNQKIDRYHLFVKLYGLGIEIDKNILQIYKFPRKDSLHITHFLHSRDLDIMYAIFYIIKYPSQYTNELLKILLKQNVELDFEYKNINFMDYLQFLAKSNNMDKKVLETFFLHGIILL